MTATVMPEEVLKTLNPEYVAPFVAFLSHDKCMDNGAMYEVGAGCIARQRWQRSAGAQYDTSNLTIENIASQWDKVSDFSKGATNPESNQEFMEVIMNHAESLKAKKAAAAPAAPPKTGLKSEGIFSMMAEYSKRGLAAEVAKKVNAAFEFSITKAKGQKPALIYEIDLKNGKGEVF